MSIEYLEIRDPSRNMIGYIDTAQSVIWHSVYYGVGDFEIYVTASQNHIDLLAVGNYVTRPDDIEVGIIESVETDSKTDGTKLIVSGRFAKSILDRRQIYTLSGKQNKATVLRGKVETAVRSLVTNNAISCSFDVARNIAELELGTLSNIPDIIVDDFGNTAEKQVSFENLLEYTDQVLKEYNLGSLVTLNDITKKLQYKVYKGVDRSKDNTGGYDPIIFSREYDNLSESRYKLNMATKKTSALIGGQGEGLERFCSLIAGTPRGINRREMWVDASSVSKTYKDDSDVEHTYSDAEYKSMLNALGKQKLAENIAEEIFEGVINTVGGLWQYKIDYNVGDIVTFQDNTLNKYVNVRLSEMTEVQDENGYNISPVFDYGEEDEEVVQYLASENGFTLLTESRFALVPESSNTTSSSSIETQGVKISDLPESTDIHDGCCIPIVTNGATKKLTYALLKERLATDIGGGGIASGGNTGDILVRSEDATEWESKAALTNTEIENLLNSMA